MKKKSSKLLNLVIIFVMIFILSACGKETLIKETCNGEAQTTLDKATIQAVGNGTVASGVVSTDKTAVSYNSSDKTFTCNVYATVCVGTLYSDSTSFMYEQFTFKGHVEGSEVIIDSSSVKQISKY